MQKTGIGYVFSCETLFRNLVLGSRIRPPARTPNLINIIRCDFCHPNAAKYDHNYSHRQTVVNSGPISAFLRIMTSESDAFGKRGTTGTVAGSVVPEFSRGPPDLPGRRSPSESGPARGVNQSGPPQGSDYPFFPIREATNVKNAELSRN